MLILRYVTMPGRHQPDAKFACAAVNMIRV